MWCRFCNEPLDCDYQTEEQTLVLCEQCLDLAQDKEYTVREMLKLYKMNKYAARRQNAFIYLCTRQPLCTLDNNDFVMFVGIASTMFDNMIKWFAKKDMVVPLGGKHYFCTLADSYPRVNLNINVWEMGYGFD